MSVYDGEIVAVTGASGFLGQHIVKELLDQGEFLVKEVRGVDLKPFSWCPELEVKKHGAKLCHVYADLQKKDEVRVALRGATAVIHTAGVVDVSPVPDVELLRSVNIHGSENVLQACIDNNIRCLVYTSTVDVVIGSQPIEGGTETTLGIPDHHLMGAYATTKYEAEKIVLKANNLILKNGQRLQTCALRPSPMFGEGDQVTLDILVPVQKYKVMFQLGNADTRYQAAYAGNVAWGHVLAVKELLKPTMDEPAAGHAFFLTDETPVGKISDFLLPFVLGVGAKVSSVRIPFWLFYVIAMIVELVAWIISPIVKWKVVLTTQTVSFAYGAYFFSSDGARRSIGYEPLYTFEDAVERSLPYYQRECGIS